MVQTLMNSYKYISSIQFWIFFSFIIRKTKHWEMGDKKKKDFYFLKAKDYIFFFCLFLVLKVEERIINARRASTNSYSRSNVHGDPSHARCAHCSLLIWILCGCFTLIYSTSFRYLLSKKQEIDCTVKYCLYPLESG